MLGAVCVAFHLGATLPNAAPFAVSQPTKRLSCKHRPDDNLATENCRDARAWGYLLASFDNVGQANRAPGWGGFV